MTRPTILCTNRWTRWARALAVGVLLGVPAAGWAQAPPATTAAPTDGATPAQPPADTDAVARALTRARESLTQLTQLPAASQLAGEPRTQVSQLITSFNELLAAQTDWRGAYAKVDTNLNAILGPENTDAEKTGGVPTGTPGAVGTSGTTPLDPTLRPKLAELRTHLNDFAKAASDAAPAIPGTPDQGASMTPQTPSGAASEGEALRHVDAIESILGATSSGPTARGTAGTNSVTLNVAKLDQIRQHLAELRKLTGAKK